jgi:hypothetical protein
MPPLVARGGSDSVGSAEAMERRGRRPKARYDELTDTEHRLRARVGLALYLFAGLFVGGVLIIESCFA